MAKIYSIYGSKGGVGKTFVAMNLAWCLHHEAYAKVLIVDAKQLVSNGLEAALSLQFSGSLAEYYSAGNHNHDDSFHTIPVNHWLGVDVIRLSTLDSHWVTTSDSQDWLKQFLKYADGKYQYIVIDIGGHLDSVLLTMVDFSDFILLVTTGCSIDLRTTSEDIGLFQKLNFRKDAIKIIVNKWEDAGDFDPKTISSRLTMSLFAAIPLVGDNISVYQSDLNKNQKDRASLKSAFLDLMLDLLHDKTTVKRGRVNDAARNENDATGAGSISVKCENSTSGVFEQEYRNLRIIIHEKLLEILDLKRIDAEVEKDPEKLKELENIIKDRSRELLDEYSDIRDRGIRDHLVHEIIQDVLYLGPLENLLNDDAVSEIMVNRWDKVYIESTGKIVESSVKFLSEKQLQRIIERIVASIGRRVDMSSPMVDARLQDGSRVNAIIPPLAAQGSVLTIRKFSQDALTEAELIKYGTFNQQIADFLDAAVKSRQNIIVSGGTGTGKTTLLNILSSCIPSDERIITIEDSVELQLRQPHVVILEARPPNVEGKGEVTIRDLVKNSLRMRPDRIVVGECRSGEALDMLQAMNTGHDGSMTTIHANSSGEMLTRLETLVMFAGFELPSRAIREQITGAVDIVVQIERLKDGSRKVVQVSEILEIKDGRITYEDIFQYRQTGTDAQGKVSGDIVSTGYMPKCLVRFEEYGLDIPKEMFWAA